MWVTPAQQNKNRTYNGMARHHIQPTNINFQHMYNAAYRTSHTHVESLSSIMTTATTARTAQRQTRNNWTRSVSLHTLTGHAVDDAVAVWIHEPDGVRCKPQTKTKSKTWPEENVEYCSIILGILCSQIQWILQKQKITSVLQANN